MKVELIDEIAVTFELCGGLKLTEVAARIVMMELEAYPVEALRKALARCRAEVKGHLAPADIIQRIDDGRPSPDEAWALCPKDESSSVCWTTEAAHAFGVARSLIGVDNVAARMAFISAYKSAVQDSKSERKAPKWELSLGHSAQEREDCVMKALSEGKISENRALMLAPGIETRLLGAGPDPVNRLVGKLSDKMSLQKA